MFSRLAAVLTVGAMIVCICLAQTNTPPTITVTSPVNTLVGNPIDLFATVTDAEDQCTFSWTFLAGSATTISPIVTVVSETRPFKWNVSGVQPPLPLGTYQFRLNATENRTDGQTSYGIITVNVAQGAPPVARIKYRIGTTGVFTEAPTSPITMHLTGSRSVALDGSTSSDPLGGTLSHSWAVDTSGLTAGTTTLLNASNAGSTLNVSSTARGTVVLTLTVRTAGNMTGTATVTLDLQGPLTLFFPQIGVGPLFDEELRTVLLLVNEGETDAIDVYVRFFGQDGSPLTPLLDGEPWVDQPLDIPAMSSRELVFSDPEIRVGWARVDSERRLFGLVQYQLINRATRELRREISLFSSAPGKKAVSFFNPSQEVAFAIANPGGSQATLTMRVRGGDPDSGAPVTVDLPGLTLAPNQQTADFVVKSAVVRSLSPGLLIIESDQDVVVTILKTTTGGTMLSTLPVSVTP